MSFIRVTSLFWIAKSVFSFNQRIISPYVVNRLSYLSKKSSEEMFLNTFISSKRLYSTKGESAIPPQMRHAFERGDKIQVEVTYFGKLGASVDVIGSDHVASSIIGEDEPVLGEGLINQEEIHYFRQMQNNLDVVRG